MWIWWKRADWKLPPHVSSHMWILELLSKDKTLNKASIMLLYLSCQDRPPWQLGGLVMLMLNIHWDVYLSLLLLRWDTHHHDLEYQPSSAQSTVTLQPHMIDTKLRQTRMSLCSSCTNHQHFVHWQLRENYIKFMDTISHHIVSPSHEAAPVQAVVPPPSCQSSGGRWWCTCACPGTSPWPRPAPPAQSPAETASWWTTRTSAAPGWSRRSPPSSGSSPETWDHWSSGRNTWDKCYEQPST